MIFCLLFTEGFKDLKSFLLFFIKHSHICCEVLMHHNLILRTSKWIQLKITLWISFIWIFYFRISFIFFSFNCGTDLSSTSFRYYLSMLFAFSIDFFYLNEFFNWSPRLITWRFSLVLWISFIFPNTHHWI